MIPKEHLISGRRGAVPNYRCYDFSYLVTPKIWWKSGEKKSWSLYHLTAQSRPLLRGPLIYIDSSLERREGAESI